MARFSLAGYSALFGKELREAWRTGGLPITLVVFFILGAISPTLAHFTPQLLQSAGLNGSGITINATAPTLKDAITQFIKNVGGNGFLIGIVLAMGSVAREKERGTVAFLLAKPVSRLALLAAKFTALLITLWLGMVVATVAAYGYTAYYFGSASAPGFTKMGLLIGLSITAYLALTFLASVLSRSTVVAAGLGFAAWLILTLLAIPAKLLPYTPTGLNDPAQALALGTTPQHLAQPIIATLLLIAAALALAVIAFARQEPTAANG
jgi:ABC-type transport system involved in multi-copper enzyme maturation permease subunit